MPTTAQQATEITEKPNEPGRGIDDLTAHNHVLMQAVIAVKETCMDEVEAASPWAAAKIRACFDATCKESLQVQSGDRQID